MAIDREMPLKEQLKFDMNAADVEVMDGDPQLDADGGATINFGPDVKMSEGHTENLAEFLNDGDLDSIARELLEAYEGDKDARADWSSTYAEGLGLLGLNYEDRNEPFPGSSGVSHPLLAESVTQFQAQSYKELFPAGGPVKTQVMGATNPQVDAQANRVKEFMNYQLTHVMEEYEPELDQMLFHLPLSGSAFRKIYFDNTLGRPVSKFVSSEDLVVPYEATDLMTCTRLTHVVKMMGNALRKFQVSGFYRDIEIGDASNTDPSEVQDKIDQLDGKRKVYNKDDIHTLLEIHADLDLPGYEDANEAGEETGISLPYIVTIEETSGEVLSIRRNWNETDPLKIKKQYFVHYKFLPGLGFYGFGLIHMLGGLSKSATSILRQLIDAGTLANLPAGFKARGLRIRDDDQPLVPGEFRDVDAPAGEIRNSLVPLPYKEPSATLFQLLGFVIESGKSFAAVADMKLGEGNEVNPVGTTMALLERGMKVMSAIHKRMHMAQGKEFKLLATLFAETLPPVYPYQVVGGNQAVKAQDFDARVDVIPVSDPNIFSITQRVTLAQQQLQLAQSNPQMHNLHEAYRRMYEAMGVQNIEIILPPPPQPQPKDPATENAEMLAGVPAQAFQGQNHDAHIEAHFALMNSSVVKGSPQVMANVQAHIMQHISIKAQEEVQLEVQQQMMQMPPEQQQMMQQQMMMDVQNRVAERESDLIAEFVAELETLMQDSMQDPLVEIKKEELNLRMTEQERKAKEAEEKLDLEKKKAKDRKTTDKERIEQQKDALAIRSAIGAEKLERDSQAKMMDKALKMTENVKDTIAEVNKPFNGGGR
jgi:hypothetical protein|tara:strand:+ start:262 stop:2718 length:2457 start_codon:yes stop_codon:yes gene_type:complete